MKQVKGWPPNINEIRASGLSHSEDTVFCYGDTMYTKSEQEIPEDVVFHEKIHSLQQKGRPDIWWQKYLISPDFRLSQELEAFSRQYQMLKTKLPNKAMKEALEEFAELLSSRYNIPITEVEAATLIRKYETT